MEKNNEDEVMDIVEEQQQDDDDDIIDDTPAFVNADDAVEVVVEDDQQQPMDEDDEEIEQEIEQHEEMSKIQLTSSHTGPVFAVASKCRDQGHGVVSLSILSGAGDDKAFCHQIDGVLNKDYSRAFSKQLQHDFTDSVSCVAWNNADFAAAGGYDGSIVILDADSHAKLHVLEGPSDVEWLSFHPKGGTVLLAGSMADGTVWMYYVTKTATKCMQVFVGHEKGVTAGAFSPDGRWALTASADGTARIWAPKTGLNKHVFSLCHEEDAGLTCLATHEQLFIVGSENGMAFVCHVGNKKVVATLRHYEEQQNDNDEEIMASVEAVGFSSSNPQWCATGGVDGNLKIWDLTTCQCRHLCKATAGITRLQWHPTLPLVFTSCVDGAVHLWDARDGTKSHTCTASNVNVVNDMSISFVDNNNTALIVTGGEDHSVRVFEINIAELLSTKQQQQQH